MMYRSDIVILLDERPEMLWRREKKSKFMAEWERLAKTQHDEVGKSGFFPIPERLMRDSDARYSENGVLPAIAQGYQMYVQPIRALFHAGATLAAYDTVNIVNPSVVIDAVCKFRLEAMDAALQQTPVDLLVMLDRMKLPRPHEWSQNPSWANDEFPEDIASGAHSLYRYARALFLKRLETPSADFIAFREAASTLDGIGIFHQDGAEKSVDPLACELFPSIKFRAPLLIRRDSDLAWREEGGEAPPVVPDELIDALPVI